MNFKEFLLSRLDGFAKEIIALSKKELRQQGHFVTGKTENSFRYEIKFINNNTIRLTIFANQSAIILNNGVLAKNVPYFRGSGNIKSKYIEALLDWAANVRRDLNEKERKSFVFAVANKHKKEGIPTRGSYAFSSNNRRTNWIEFGIDNNIGNLIDTLKLNEFLKINNL